MRRASWRRRGGYFFYLSHSSGCAGGSRARAHEWLHPADRLDIGSVQGECKAVLRGSTGVAQEVVRRDVSPGRRGCRWSGPGDALVAVADGRRTRCNNAGALVPGAGKERKRAGSQWRPKDVCHVGRPPSDVPCLEPHHRGLLASSSANQRISPV
ncbi:hypothetical protein VUR80DRAFT_8499 [Thermomyces stellatus]